MVEQFLKACKKTKNQDQKKAASSPKDTPPKKQQRKGENPVRFLPATDQSANVEFSDSWICKNSACRATVSLDDTFCKRCSCCICHSFDDNKDPSLWLECSSETEEVDSCGLTCHIECALQLGKVGVVDLGQLMQLDGSYCCASCGKVSGILGCWKKQLYIAKDARRVDILCYRLFLSYRLLKGTSRFEELHEFIKEAKAKLEMEFGPVNGILGKMPRGIVSRLSVARDVHTLCSLAIEKADKWLARKSNETINCSEGSLPAACKFLFEEVTPYSVVIILIELFTALSDDIKGYKLWYRKATDESYTKEPVCSFSKAHRRVLISNLQPCSEYSFRIVSYADSGDIGHSEVRCFTKSVEISHRITKSGAANHVRQTSEIGGSSNGETDRSFTIIKCDSGFKIRDLGRILRLVSAQPEGCFDGSSGEDKENSREVVKILKPEPLQVRLPSVSRQLDLNVASVPDLNEELTPPVESSRDEDNRCTFGRYVDMDDVVSHEIERNAARPHGSGDSQNWNAKRTLEVSTVDSRVDFCRKRRAGTSGEARDSDSTLVNESTIKICNGSGSLDENFEYCVKIIRWLECDGYIDKDFRLKLLTWFSLRSTEQERRVVNAFIQALIDDPSSLAGQLVDSFSDIISSKRMRNGFCDKLWH